MSQVNNLTGLNKSRPPQLREGENQQYFGQVELWIKQVYDNLTGLPTVPTHTVVELEGGAATVLATDYDPAVTGRAALVHVSNETGGATLAASDGINWRRVSDGAVVS